MPNALAKRVVGATWHTNMIDRTIYPYSSGRYGNDPFDFLSRFQQIHRHVVRNNVEKWLVIDDLHSGTEEWPEGFEQYLIQTDEKTGLGCLEKQTELKKKLELINENLF